MVVKAPSTAIGVWCYPFYSFYQLTLGHLAGFAHALADRALLAFSCFLPLLGEPCMKYTLFSLVLSICEIPDSISQVVPPPKTYAFPAIDYATDHALVGQSGRSPQLVTLPIRASNQMAHKKECQRQFAQNHLQRKLARMQSQRRHLAKSRPKKV